MTLIRHSLAVALSAALTLPAISVFAPTAVAQNNINESQQVWGDDRAVMDRTVSELMAKMTLHEKIGQMNLLTSGWDVTGPSVSDDYLAQIEAGKVGGLFNAFTAGYTRRLQQIAVEKTRLGIPLLFGYDVIHGHRTIFPISLGEAASWDLQAIKKGSQIAAAEASADGIHWTFAPMVDISRDPRWGRVSEGAGEDVFLATAIARARVAGFQGDDLASTDTVLACAKHYAAYGQAQAGRDYNTTNMSERELWDTYLPPFKALNNDGVATFMTSFNELNGIPATGNHYLLRDVLKERWGFEGFVVTDYTSINEMIPHGYAADLSHAAEIALKAGVDMDMQGEAYSKSLKQALEKGTVNEADIDDAVKRILEMKYRLGLFDDPYRYSNNEREKTVIGKPEYQEAARDVARKSMVLLKNQNNALPLQTSDQRIALIGPLADSKQDMIGSWAAAGDRHTQPVTLLEGLREKLGNNADILTARGASYDIGSMDNSGFDEAMIIARQADVIVLAMGEKWDMTGEAASRVSIDLPGTQLALMKQLKQLGKPMILVLMNGRPLTINWAQDNVDAILEAWYPGSMGGHAIADVLVGDYNPSGKLPMTFPRSEGQIPIFYNRKNTGRPYEVDGAEQKYRSRYLDESNSPLYPFGFGLSYTSFGYSEVTLSDEALAPEGTISVTVTVTNTGEREGEEVVQLYVRDKIGSVTRPVRELKGFQKVGLAAGESREVTFDLSASDLAFHRADMSYGFEQGQFDVFVGGSSTASKRASFTLTESGQLAAPPPSMRGTL